MRGSRGSHPRIPRRARARQRRGPVRASDTCTYARHQQLTAGLANISRNGRGGKLIEEIRGDGLMIGVQFSTPRDNKISKPLTQECLKRQMLLLSTSSFDVVRWIPPLTVSEAEIDEALRIFEAALDAAAADAGLL